MDGTKTPVRPSASAEAFSDQRWRRHLRIVLVASRNSLNIGAAARAMSNFGFEDLWCVRPYEPSFRSAASAVGASAVMRAARVSDHLDEALADVEVVIGCTGLESRRQRHVQRLLPAAGKVIRTALDTRRAALLFGSEKSGLTNDDLSHCDWVLSIPTSEDCPSMNLGQAVAVCCYEISRHLAAEPSLRHSEGVSVGVRNRILGQLLPLLKTSGFLHGDGTEAQTRRLRRFIGRLRLAPEDARMLQAILHQVGWRLNQAENTDDPQSQPAAKRCESEQVVG